MFIGVDQSFSDTGLCILTDPLKYTTFSIKSKGSQTAQRLNSVACYIKEQLRGHTPILACVEGGAFNASGRIFSLGQLSGAILLTLHQSQIPVLEVAPTMLKKFMTGVGSADKHCMMKKIKEKYDQHFTNDNLADAYALAMFAYRYHFRTVCTFREEYEVIYSLNTHTHKKTKTKPKKISLNF